jgi:hypothetical protein
MVGRLERDDHPGRHQATEDAVHIINHEAHRRSKAFISTVSLRGAHASSTRPTRTRDVTAPIGRSDSP